MNIQKNSTDTFRKPAKIPPYLKKGDAVGIVCPSGFMAIDKAQTCIKTLQQWGFKVVVGKTLGSPSANYFSGTDAERSSDLQALLDDKNIQAILCARGGYGLSRIVDGLDFTKFKKHPKWIIGFSDITVLHSYIFSNLHIATLHAPMAAAFSDGGFKNIYVKSLKNALLGKKILYKIPPHYLNKLGLAQGPLIGGNLSLLVNSIGTSSDIDTKNKILFIEDIGEYIYSIDRMLYQLKRSGKLSNLKALLVGGFTDIKDTERPFGQAIYPVINDVVAEYNYPVCFNFPASHATENYALKIGIKYNLTVAKNKVVLAEI